MSISVNKNGKIINGDDADPPISIDFGESYLYGVLHKIQEFFQRKLMPKQLC